MLVVESTPRRGVALNTYDLAAEVFAEGLAPV